MKVRVVCYYNPPCLESHYTISHPGYAAPGSGGLTYYSSLWVAAAVTDVFTNEPSTHVFMPFAPVLRLVFAAAMNNINFNRKCRYNSRLSASKEFQYLLQLFWKLVILIHVLYMNNLKTFNVFSICEQLQTYFLVFPRTVCG